MENLWSLFLFTVAVALAILVNVFMAHVILSIAGLYGVTFITNFSLAQVFCITNLIALFKIKRGKDKKLEEQIVETFEGAIIILVIWGFMFLCYPIVTKF